MAIVRMGWRVEGVLDVICLLTSHMIVAYMYEMIPPKALLETALATRKIEMLFWLTDF